MKRVLWIWLLLVFGPITNLCYADTFGSGASSFNIEFVPIGDPGNLQDDFPNPAGAVGYRYRMGKYEVSEQMIDKANALGGLGITKDTRGSDKPATSVTWFEAAKFVNWLNESKGHTPAYKFDSAGTFQLWEHGDLGYDPTNLFRNSQAKYFLPSIHEWHKSAYYDPVAGHYWDYPTGSDTVPDGIDFVGDPMFDAVFIDGAFNPDPNEIQNVGLLSPFGTAGQGGNVSEWEETAFDRQSNISTEQRSDDGGDWRNAHNILAAWHTGIGIPPAFEADFLGFRVGAKIPEPCSLVQFGASIAAFFVICRQSSGLLWQRHYSLKIKWVA